MEWKVDREIMKQKTPSLKKAIELFGSFLNQERTIIFPVLIYAVAVGLFSLIIPITVQELVNTFAFAISPVMVFTIVAIMAGILLVVGIFRVLQFYATDVIERRIFARMTLTLSRILPRYKELAFKSDSINRFFETIFLQRSFSSLFVDFINLLVGGFIGMFLLALYHPYFLIFDAALIVSAILIAILGKGGLHRTLQMSEAKYETFHWFQEVANNLLHFKATNCSDLIMRKADNLAAEYIRARQSRFSVLLRQFIGSLLLQVMLHTGLLGTAGWLLSQGELTLGQLVAAEVIIASILLKLGSVVKRSYAMFYFFTALTELDHMLSLPQDNTGEGSTLSIPKSTPSGLHLSCSQLSWASDAESAPKGLLFEAHPGEKWAVICPTEWTRHRLALVLAGLDQPRAGVVRYNGVDLRSLSADQIGAQRGIVFGSDYTLFKGSVAENITMGRPGIKSKDLIWASTVSQLDEILEELPNGLETMVQEGGKGFTPSQRLRILLTRAIVIRPSLLILDGAMLQVPSHIREPILHRLSADGCPWTLIIVTTNENITTYVEKSLSLSNPPKE